jgi:putative transposase
MRSTNPIESTFATVRHRTIRSKGCLSNKTALAMVYKLTDAAQKSWRRLDDPNQLPKLIQGCEIYRRSRGHLAPNSSRRPISSVTNFRR